VAEYDVDPAECDSQIHELIGGLAVEELIRYCE
jgi:hypothetical protein